MADNCISAADDLKLSERNATRCPPRIAPEPESGPAPDGHIVSEKARWYELEHSSNAEPVTPTRTGAERNGCFNRGRSSLFSEVIATAVRAVSERLTGARAERELLAKGWRAVRRMWNFAHAADVRAHNRGGAASKQGLP